MRDAFAQAITALAEEEPRLVLLSGDIGNRLFDDFKRRAPERFFNCGVAEANLMGMAAGLALSGLRPVAYTIAPFITSRCLEQIRVDVCLHRAPVVITGVGAGLGYASLGATHHSCEDIALMRVLPGMTVVCPGDPVEVRLALRAALRHPGPTYLRLGKKGEAVVHREAPDLRIGRAIPLREGEAACLLACGNVLPLAVKAAEELEERATRVAVASFPTVKPLDEEFLAQTFSRFPLVVTLEEHSRLGGLGGAVAEWLADRGAGPARLLRLGTADEFIHCACDQESARRRFGLTSETIASRVSQALEECPRGALVGEALVE